MVVAFVVVSGMVMAFVAVTVMVMTVLVVAFVTLLNCLAVSGCRLAGGYLRFYGFSAQRVAFQNCLLAHAVFKRCSGSAAPMRAGSQGSASTSISESR
jgi:hypothetical protein